jgi:hypothetical protein
LIQLLSYFVSDAVASLVVYIPSHTLSAMLGPLPRLRLHYTSSCHYCFKIYLGGVVKIGMQKVNSYNYLRTKRRLTTFSFRSKTLVESNLMTMYRKLRSKCFVLRIKTICAILRSTGTRVHVFRVTLTCGNIGIPVV